MSSQLCMTCCSTIPSGSSQHEVKPKARPFVHGCCGRTVCTTCMANNARLATFCPFCEDAQTAFRKGRRHDVTRAGDTIFDLDKALQADDGAAAADDAPPAYAAGPEFVLEDEGEQLAFDATGPQTTSTPSSSRPMVAAKGELSQAEVVTGQAKDQPSTPDALALPQRVKATSPSSGDASEEREEQEADKGTVQYWLRKEDTLAGLALRFKISAAELCALNQLPRSTQSTTPHVLHTRRWILLPAAAVSRAGGAADAQLQEALAGPPKQSTASKVASARRGAEARFRATIMRSGQTDETPPDERAARAYVALVEHELAWVEFGDEEHPATDSKKQPSTSDATQDEAALEQREQLRDAGRAARYDAILTQAVAKWMMDSDWERAARAAGLDPSQVSHARKSHSRTQNSLKDAVSQLFSSSPAPSPSPSVRLPMKG